MSFFYLLENHKQTESGTTIEKKGLQLDVDLLAVRKAHPGTYLYMFLVATNIFKDHVDSTRFTLDGKEQPIPSEGSTIALLHDIYPRDYKNTSSMYFFRPDLTIITNFIKNPSQALGFKGIAKDITCTQHEPIAISEQEYKQLSEVSSGEDHFAINQEINAIYQGRKALIERVA